ncbi:MAG: hypothetical protein A2W00_04930 [Candidatus Eisenbacteria bacterium RBG_16_71_46]|nr:MAG: hypothetical protein A2W00_04930 [Candidatus Eisenbacteria bacterium RBG_16_71_46]OGF21925.1 MAG: hypothetical protein A2V63_08175 [Candidatus Eisenbacteria bacterium RBG_19FT_COMBO_70_11]
MYRLLLFGAVVLAALDVAAARADDSAVPQTLVLPFRTVGVSDTTATVVAELLQGELEGRGVSMVARSLRSADLLPGESACDDAECAKAAARSYGASRVIYGSLSRLRDKIIVRVRAQWIADAAPYYADQVTSTTEEDLDAVVRRVADGIALGRSNAQHATIETVTAQETLEPRRRVGRSGGGLRAGFIFPVGDSYGGVDRLTSLRLAHVFEIRDYLIESTPVLGFAWRSGTVDWTLLDVFAARIFGIGDFAPYVGAGLGVHSVRVEKQVTNYSGTFPYLVSSEQSETTLSADVGVGFLALRTYDYKLVMDLRYHYVFAEFDQLGGKGAHGVAISFGTMR